MEIGDTHSSGISLEVWSKATGGRVPADLLEVELARQTDDAQTAAEVMQAEAVRLLRPGGCLAVFDGDYATATLAVRAGDLLDLCADAFREHFVHDPWLVRRLPALVRAAGVELRHVRSYGYVETSAPGFMLRSWVDLGADALVASGRIGADAAAALKAEARRRLASGEYFAHIAYMSLVARKPTGEPA